MIFNIPSQINSTDFREKKQFPGFVVCVTDGYDGAHTFAPPSPHLLTPPPLLPTYPPRTSSLSPQPLPPFYFHP